MYKSIINKYKPKGLFSRFLLIIILPTIIAQIIATYIFYQRHWSNVSGYMINNLCDEIYLITDLYKDKKVNRNLIDKITKDLKLQYFTNYKEFNKKNIEDNMIQLYEKISYKISLPINIIYNKSKNLIDLEIKINDEILTLNIPKRRIDNPTTYIFILWMTGCATIFASLSIIFLKNQTRSIIKLADIVDKFGKGRITEDFRPSGASEIRKAGIAFLKMKERIEKQIKQKTFMLAAISHDLRTPLTRIKLELSMIDNDITDHINNDVMEMEEMIRQYLEFAKDEDNESSSVVNLYEFILDIIKPYKLDIIINSYSYIDNLNKYFVFICKKDHLIFVKTNSFRRAIINLINNSIKYHNNYIKIICNISNNLNIIRIIDDGIGIIESEKKNIFRPFYKIDNSRNNINNVGLGLAIVKDIISNHGGEIKVKDNIPNGLEIMLSLPI